jgi:hypothetical protein
MASVDTAAVHLSPSLYLRDMVLTSHVSNGPGGLKTRLSSQPAFVIFLSLHYFFLSLDFSFVLFLFFFSAYQPKPNLRKNGTGNAAPNRARNAQIRSPEPKWRLKYLLASVLNRSI